MVWRIPVDHNYRTECPPIIKAKITALETAALMYAIASDRHVTDHAEEKEAAQTARYNLERTILTCIDTAVNAALDPNTKRTK